MDGRSWLATALLALTLAGCASSQRLEERPLRPECAPFDAAIYFEPGETGMPPASAAIFRDIMDRIAACRSAGGDVTRLIVTAYPDRDARPREAGADVRARARTIRQALVAAGAPERRVRIARAAPDDQLMQRRAEIVVEMR